MQNKTRRDTIPQYNTRARPKQDNTMQDNTAQQDKTQQGKTRHENTSQAKTKQNKTNTLAITFNSKNKTIQYETNTKTRT